MSNCFEFRCPNCGGEDQIDIEALTWIRVTEDGTDADISENGGAEFGPESNAMCGGCGHTGKLQAFTPEEVQP